MESSRQISVRDPVSHRLSDRDDPAKYDLENGMETENPGIFLSDPEFCRERYFRRCIFRRDTAAERRFFLLLILCGFTVFGVPLSVVYMLILGLETGMVLAMSVLEFGLYGGLAGAALLLPQYLIYVPVYFWLARLVYRQSFGIWKNYGLFPAKNLPYLKQVITAFGVYTGGIMAECFLNPWLVEKIIKYLKFF